MRKLIIAAASVAMLAAAPASATTLGTDAAAVSGSGCGSDIFAWETDPAFTVPAGGGIITSLAMNATDAGGALSLKVVRASGANGTVVATTPQFTVQAGANVFPVRVAVQGGEFLGLYAVDGIADCIASSAGTTMTRPSAGGDPPVGTTLSASGAVPAMLSLKATFEPDADHDGFGDETEDTCPSDAAIHTGSCVVDVGVTQSVIPTTIGIGDIAVATVTIANGSTGTGTGVTMQASVTPGLQILSTIPSAGCTFTAALNCPLGSLAGGANAVKAVVVKGVHVGSQTITSGVLASSTDPNNANNATSTAISVERRVALRCNVPSLKGLTKAIAKRLLSVANCKLGTATKKKAKTGKVGTVIKQSKKAGKKLPAGSKVNVILKK